MSSLITFRLRHPQGTSTISLDPDKSIQTLLDAITKETSIPASDLELKSGYPPKVLAWSSPTSSIASLKLAKTEQLIVSASSSSGSIASRAKTPPAPASTSKPPPSLISSTGAGGLFGGAVSSSSSSARPPTTSNGVKTEGDDGKNYVQIQGGYFCLHVVPDDNSCLFAAVAAIFEGGEASANKKLRQVVADTIRADPSTYNELFLERPPEQYISTILKPTSWGGAIELSIFSKHYKTEITSVDVATGRMDKYGEGEYDQRCVLVYSGIHYDAALLSPTPKIEHPAFCETQFLTSNALILHATAELASKLKSRHYYTDTASFDLRCGVCKVGLKGEKEAREHAMSTGHVDFGEY